MNLDETERRLIAVLLSRPASFHDVGDKLTAEHFAEPICRAIWTGIAAVHEEGVFDLSLVEARASRPSEDVDLMSRIFALAAVGEKLGDIEAEALAAPLVDRHVRGKARALLGKLDHAIKDMSKPVAEVLEAAAGTIQDLAATGTREESVNLGEAAKAVREKALAARDAGYEVGISTGLPSLDEALDGGVGAGDMVVIAGYSYCGKTTLALQIAMSVASKGLPVLYQQNEMSAEQMAARLSSAEAGVTMTAMLRGRFDAQQEEAMVIAEQQWLQWPLEIRCDPGIAIEQVLSRWKAHKAHKGLALGVLDAAKRFGSTGKFQDQVARTGHVFTYAKRIALELQIPVFVIAHPTRGGRDATQRMTPEEIFGGGNSVETADQVWLVHRPEPKLAEAQPERGSKEYEDWQNRMDEWRGRAQVHVPKFRGGASHRFAELQFDGSKARFVDPRA